MISLLGLAGGVLFSWAAVPAAWSALKKGHTQVPVNISWAITLGTLLMFTYLTARNGLDWVLCVNYGAEFISWAVLLYFHYFPRQEAP